MKKTPREIMILVVESFPGMALLWKRKLENLWGNDVRIISAESESETLKILRRMPAIDIIITNAVLGQYPLGSKRRADAIPLVKKFAKPTLIRQWWQCRQTRNSGTK